MKTWKLVSGILSIMLFVWMIFQSFAVGFANIILNTGEFSGFAGIVVAILMLAGGIVSISTRNIGKDGDITLILLFGIAALIGLKMAGSIYLDLYVWAFWGAVNVITAMVSFTQKNSESKEVYTVNKTAISNYSTERIIENKDTDVIGAEENIEKSSKIEINMLLNKDVENATNQQDIENKKFMWVLFVVIVCTVFTAIIMSNSNIRFNEILTTEESTTKHTLPVDVSIDDNGAISVKPSAVGDIFPNSGRVYLTLDNIRGMDEKTIRLGLNEIYARRGKIFKDKDLKDYFNAKSWYAPLYTQEEFASIEDTVFNSYEKDNIKLLERVANYLHENGGKWD